MKLCGSESVLTIGGAIILVLFLIVCIFGIVNDGKNSCHNVLIPTMYDTSKWKPTEIEDANKTINKCLDNAKIQNPTADPITNRNEYLAQLLTSNNLDKVKNCINESGFGGCVEGAGSMVFLIICIVLIVLVFGLLMWCTFGKNRVGGGGPGGLY